MDTVVEKKIKANINNSDVLTILLQKSTGIFFI